MTSTFLNETGHKIFRVQTETWLIIRQFCDKKKGQFNTALFSYHPDSD